MDVDRFIAANQPAWDRLEALTRRAGRRASRLSPSELDELVRLYQRTSTHLSMARTTYRDPGLTAALSGLVGRAGSVVYGTRPRTLRALRRFVTDTFPAAVWHARWFVVAATALFVVPAALIALWLGTSPAGLAARGPQALLDMYGVDTFADFARDFSDYYSVPPSALFASEVTTNNIQVAIVAFAGGVAACLPTAGILVVNGANVGVAWGLFAAAEQQPIFWGLILPHGLLELTAVFVAGAAGLRLGWALIDPGDRARGTALVEEGRRAIVIVIGLVAVFSVAGLIEGFVTGSTLPTWSRVAVGVLAQTLFTVYVVVRGRDAARRGLTGAVGESERPGWRLQPA